GMHQRRSRVFTATGWRSNIEPQGGHDWFPCDLRCYAGRMGPGGYANGVLLSSTQIQGSTDNVAERLELKKTAVILGMQQGTMGEFDQTRDDCDVFVMNEMLSRRAVARADYVMQLHKPAV